MKQIIEPLRKYQNKFKKGLHMLSIIFDTLKAIEICVSNMIQLAL